LIVQLGIPATSDSREHYLAASGGRGTGHSPNLLTLETFVPLGSMYEPTKIKFRCALSTDDKGIAGKIEPVTAPRGQPKHALTVRVQYPLVLEPWVESSEMSNLI
jgi:hypothetical protein